MESQGRQQRGCGREVANTLTDRQLLDATILRPYYACGRVQNNFQIKNH